jgi:hypothetical protein
MKKLKFDYSLDYKNLNLREQPELYRIGIGEQGVLLVEPYKSEILPHWRFKTVPIAEESASAIYKMFLDYRQASDFVGMDMARKFLQMGYTRARRYANHASGKKYEANPQKESTKEKEAAARKRIRPQEKDWGTSEKAEAARIFYGYYIQAREDETYKRLKAEHETQIDRREDDK